MMQPDSLQYHQKAALLDNITARLRDIGATSLLDIGAGSLETALPLSRQVSAYLAVEQDEGRAARLRDAGLEVIHGAFPVPIGRRFDLVLSSHSVPEDGLATYPAFLDAAWNLTADGGMLLIVTFKGSQGAVAELRHEICGDAWQPSPELACIVTHCRGLGVTTIDRVNSFVEARRAEDVARYMAPWLSRGAQTKDSSFDALAATIETRWKVRGGLYVFPTEHLFVACRRAPRDN